MGKLTEAVRRLGTKLTGKPTVESNSLVTVINDIADDYEDDDEGGLKLVNELPEVGDEGLLYKTPDGKIWSCTNTTETETVCSLEVGKSFKLVERNLIVAEALWNLCTALDNIGWKTSDSSADVFFNGEENYPLGHMSITTDPETGDTTVHMSVYINENSYVSYEGTNEAELHNLSELPSIEITQQFVTDITTAGLELMDWAFLFQNSTHTEEITTSTWSQVDGGISVVANPTLTGTEDTLTGLQVGETKYKVPEGGSGGGEKLYSGYDIAKAINGKVLNYTKFLAFLEDIGIDTTSVILDDFSLQTGSIDNSGSVQIFSFSTVASGADNADYELDIASSDGKNAFHTGYTAKKSLSQLNFTFTAIDFDIENDENLDYGLHAWQFYTRGIIGLYENSTYRMIPFNIEDFLNCLDTVNNA